MDAVETLEMICQPPRCVYQTNEQAGRTRANNEVVSLLDFVIISRCNERTEPVTLLHNICFDDRSITAPQR